MPQWSESLTGALLHESMEDLYEHAPCGYVSLAPDGTIGKVNGTFVEWTGFGKQELVGQRRFVDLLNVGGRIYYETHFQPLLRMQGRVSEIALELTCRNGQRLPVLVNANQQIYPDVGAITRIMVFDATDRRRYERELLFERQRAEAAARAKADLLATISHDVRSPLSAMMTAITLLEKSSPSAAQARYLQVLRASAGHALTLIDNLLDLGRLEAGRSSFREAPFALRDLVNEVAEAARVAALQKADVEVRAEVDEACPETVVGDRVQIGQVLANLMMNAVKFTERGFVLLVVGVGALEPERVTLDVAVSDTGIGIPPDRLSRIFEEYTQASDDIARSYGGTGLGLTISRRILRLFGSDLSVTSTVGEGTRFWFSLTLRRG